MKKNLTFLSTAMAVLLLCGLQKANAQAWVMGGNNNVTKDTSIGIKGAYSLKLMTSNLERMRISDAGNVGIGTTAVNSAKFTVNGTVGNTMALLGTKLHGVSLLNDPGGIGFNNYYSGGWKTLNDGYGGYITSDNTTGSMQFATAPFGTKNSFTYPTVRMTILSSGYVGIGTTTPGSTLDVAGNQTLQGNLNFTSGTQSIQFANPGSTPAPMMYMFQSGTINTNRMVIAHSPSYPTWGLQYTDANDQFDFLGAGTSRMTIQLGSGNVGIGVTAPVYKLEVCGTIRAKEVRVETGWCDYVFEKNYKLRSINELEQYINTNKHLPGIAPASEVEKDGLKVAEMNKAMMEKIEELTLYVIQLSKDNQKLQGEVDALKK